MAVTNSILTILNTKEDTQSVINGIRNEDPKIIEMLYRKNFSRIKNMVRSFNFRHLEPMDIFQEGLTRAVLNVRNGKFNGTSTFSTYLYGICRFICLKELSKNPKMVQVDVLPEVADISDDRFELLQRILELRQQLEPPCRELIDLRFCQSDEEASPDKCLSFEKIAELLQIRADNARKRFERCLERFRKLAQGDSQILDLIG